MKSTLLGVLFALVVAAAVVASPTGEAAQEEQVLIYAGATDHFAGEETATDPGFENNYDMTGPSYESLIGYDPELLRRDPPEYVLVPHLAESYSTDDRIVWTFNLRRSVKFHTGNEMQADDVKFSIERVARWEEYFSEEAMAGPPNMRAVTPVIESVEIVDDYTVRIHGRDGKPQLLMLDTLSFGHLAIMDREVVRANEKGRGWRPRLAARGQQCRHRTLPGGRGVAARKDRLREVRRLLGRRRQQPRPRSSTASSSSISRRRARAGWRWRPARWTSSRTFPMPSLPT